MARPFQVKARKRLLHVRLGDSDVLLRHPKGNPRRHPDLKWFPRRTNRWG